MRIAKSGHSHSHNRQPVQAAGSNISTTSCSFKNRQRSGQTLTQISQPLHQASVISSSARVLTGSSATGATNSAALTAGGFSAHSRPVVNARRLNLDCLGRHGTGNQLLPVLNRKIERCRQRPQQHGVRRFRVTQLGGNSTGIQRQGVGQL